MSDGPEKQTESVGDGGEGASQAWVELAEDYQQARTRDDSLDRLVEWPAQRNLLGDVTGRSVLDVGCGNGSKLAELVQAGATQCVGVDISDNFLTPLPQGLRPPRVERPDLSQ